MKTEKFLSGRFDRLNDVYFKFLFASPERKELTIAFVNAVLSHIKIKNEPVINIQDVEFLDREIISESESAKGSRFDLYAHSSDGRRFHIEVQKAREDFFMKRSFYYAAYDYVSQLNKGAGYNSLEPVIFIGIVNFDLFHRKDYQAWHTVHRVVNIMTGECDFHDFEIHMIEIPLLRRYIKKMNMKPSSELEELLCYLGSIGGEGLMAELASKNPVIEKMQEYEEFFRANSGVIREYLFNKRFEQDMAETRRREREEARAKGERKGRAEGIKENSLETAKYLLKQGILSVEQIAQAVNLPVKTVAELKI